MLGNPIYIGEVRYRDRTYPGRHDPIVDHALWDRVQALRDANRRARRMRIGSRHPSPLAGMIHDEAGQPLTPSHASKGGVRYRYYVSHSLVTRRADDHPGAWRLAAEPVERAARNALAKLLRGRDVARALTKGASAADAKAALGNVARLAAEIEKRPTVDRRILLSLDARVVIISAEIELSVSLTALADRIGCSPAGGPDRLIERAPFSIRKRGRESRMVLGDEGVMSPDRNLIETLRNAECWAQQLLSGAFTSVRALARHLDEDHRRVARTLPLAFLAPDIRTAILEGRHPAGLTPSTLRRLHDLPCDWSAQRSLLGFDAAA